MVALAMPMALAMPIALAIHVEHVIMALVLAECQANLQGLPERNPTWLRLVVGFARLDLNVPYFVVTAILLAIQMAHGIS